MSRTWRLVPGNHGLVLLLAGLLGAALATMAGCGMVGLADEFCGDAEIPPADPQVSPIAKAIHFLRHTQLTADFHERNKRDWEGNWPQCFGRDGLLIRDVSPFIPTFIHHALTLITEANRDALGLSGEDLAAAREMRIRAVEFILRFAIEPPCPDSGTFGFWPHIMPAWQPGDVLLARRISQFFDGPQFMGVLTPLNMSFYPRTLRIAPDADDTANVYAVLLDHHLLDGGAPVDIAFEEFFVAWRDLGQVPQRHVQPWLPPRSGAFLTWLAYHDDPDLPNLNDVDLLVNVNVLYALGRFNRRDMPGVAEAVALINAAIESGAHLTNPNHLSLYYPDNLALHHLVARAYRQGGVIALAPALEAMVQDLLLTALPAPSGGVHWNRGDPHLNTALAVLALCDAGGPMDLIDLAVEYLVAEQDPLTGGWAPGVFFVGRMDNGSEIVWVSPALTTAFALEAIAAHQLLVAGQAFVQQAMSDDRIDALVVPIGKGELLCRRSQ